MATEKDRNLVQFLLNGTNSGEVKWEATAVVDQYASIFKGKYTITVDRGELDRSAGYFYFLTLKDNLDKELLQLLSGEIPQIKELFHKAARASLNVDAAIDEIIGDSSIGGPPKVKDDDIPF